MLLLLLLLLLLLGKGFNEIMMESFGARRDMLYNDPWSRGSNLDTYVCIKIRFTLYVYVDQVLGSLQCLQSKRRRKGVFGR